MFYKDVAKLVMGFLLLLISGGAYATPNLIVGSVSGSLGDTITVPVTFENNGSVGAMQATVMYDAAIMTANSVNGVALGATIFTPSVATAGQVVIAAANIPATNALTDGNITIEFTINAGASLGATNLTLSGVVFSDGAANVVANDTITNGIVTVTGPEVSITATDADAAEAATDTGTFTVTRTGSTAAALTVNLVVSGTATTVTDYVAIPATIVIPVGDASATLTVTPVNDVVTNEGDETVVVAIGASANYTVDVSPATVTIADDDAVDVSIVLTTQAEESATPVVGVFTVTRTGPTGSALVVNLIISGTAVNGVDHTAIPNTLTIPAGDGSATISVTPIDNGTVDGLRSIIITLDAGAGYNVLAAGNNAEIRIVDDEAVVVPSSIPTLSEWALILLSLMLLLVATRYSRRHQ